jgi:hypothetical protein
MMKLENLTNNELSKVEFIHDYIQLFIGGFTMNLFNPVSVQKNGQMILRSQKNFSEEIEKLVGKKIKKTNYKKNIEASLLFDNGVKICISLDQNQSNGPEAFMLLGGPSEFLVEQNA